MAAAAVRNKSGPPRKGNPVQDNASSPRRTQPWRPANSPANNPSYTPSPRLAHQFPTLAPAPGPAPDAPIPPPSLIGSTIHLHTRTGHRYEGALHALPAPADADPVLVLRDVRDLARPASPPKDTLSLPAPTIASWALPDPASKLPPASDFRTDSDIAAAAGPRRERELQAWLPDENDPVPPLPPSGAHPVSGDDATFGPGATAPNGSWDQFAANERMFGVTTSFNEDVYTTKLDRSTPDFKERERKAAALANEILSGTSNNPHISEERNVSVDDSGVNEEDKYAGVTRGPNAYIPPARRAGSGNSLSLAPKPTSTLSQSATISADAPPAEVSSNPSSKPTSPPAAAANSNNAASPPAKDLIPTFRDFVTNEKQRLTQKRQALVKNEMDKRMSELVKFSQSFKLNKPIPEDLVAILAKDEQKQQQIREKSSRDAASVAARAIASAGGARAVPPAKPPAAPAPASKAPAAAIAASPHPKKEGAPVPPRIPMVIQKIPPFDPSKRRSQSDKDRERDKDKDKDKDDKEKEKDKDKDAAFKLNANASSFKFKPGAPAFKPVVPSPSPKSKSLEPATQPPAQPNPFFGTRVLKKGTPVHVKDDFNPFKSAANGSPPGKVPEVSSVSSTWSYTGKRYNLLFPSLPVPPATAAPLVPHVAPMPQPPQPYEEDPSHRGAYTMVYPYSPYAAYPQQGKQPMMAPPPGAPPGGYVPSPFLQPMHYPPMPPNGHQAMYAPPPSMGNMPPPQQYMQPPPPGAYPPPPPPNGAGRGSMPPTPMPPHAHAYAYHQSPQLSHAVPYPMMMPPPPSGPPHANYEGAAAAPPPPPVQMGGVGHA